MNFFYIGIGGGIGAILRFLCVQFFNARINTFPVGTLCVNTLGSFTMGFLFSAFRSQQAPTSVQFFCVTGFLGGYTALSTYSLETVRFLLAGNIKSCLLNIAATNILSFGSLLLGMVAGKALFRQPL